VAKQHKVWKHDELLDDLFKHLSMPDQIILKEPHMGSSYLNGGRVAIPDLFAFKKSYTNPDMRVYEVKVSDSDLRGDVMSGKWEKYLPYCDRLIFAFPDYIDWEPILGNQLAAGVMVRYPNCWRTVRKGALNQKRTPFEEETFVALMIYLTESRHEIERLEREKVRLLSKDINDLRHSADQGLARKAAELADRESKLEYAMRSQRQSAFKEIFAAMGINTWLQDGREIEKLIEVMFTAPMKLSAEQIVSKGFNQILELKKSQDKASEIL
jgi:hypothetical protein